MKLSLFVRCLALLIIPCAAPLVSFGAGDGLSGDRPGNLSANYRPEKPEARQDKLLSDGWRFIKSDAGLTASTEDWQTVTIPHTWNTRDVDNADHKGDPNFKSGYYRGACWYERTIQIPAAWKGKRVFIRFEAASLVARTYINGQLLGEHRGGFTAFSYELTPYLKFGASNELRVQVDNSHQDDIPPLSGDFNVDGGIYRPVHLIVTDAVCISPLEMASSGVFITTKALTNAGAQVEVRGIISNGGSEPANVQIIASVAGADGKTAPGVYQIGDANSVASGAGTIASGTTGSVVARISIPKPHLWNGRKDPYLYKVTIALQSNGRIVDSETQPLGLRTFDISEEKGFELNGQPYPIYGVNRHQDWGGQGWAASPANYNTDMQMMLDMGVTAIRLTHYPQSDTLHDLCDRNGILLWNEVSLVNYISDSPAFEANAEQQLRELITQRYNHPSVVFWGLFNELDNSKGPLPAPLITKLKSVVQELDPNRIIVAATDHFDKPYNLIPDHVAWNFYPGWYGPYGQIASQIERGAKEFGKRIALSEYGAGANPNQHEEGPLTQVKPKGPFHPIEWQTRVHETDWAAIQGNPHVWGSFLWVMFDFQVAGRNEGGQPHINDKGMVTQDRKTKKDVYYFYQANWTEKPMIHIASKGMTPRRLADTGIEVFSNCAKVELIVNGKSVGEGTADNVKVFRWADVKLAPGKNRVVATGTTADGKSVTDSCDWTLDPAAAPTPPGADVAFPSATPLPAL